MKYLFRLLLLIASIGIILALIGSLLPRNYEFTSEVDIAASNERVFDELNRLSNWQTWSQWNPAEIPDLTVRYSGPETGVGSTQSWTDIRGRGKLWITTSQPYRRIEYDLRFANFPTMSSVLDLTVRDGQTHVRWTSRGRLPGGPFYGFLAPFFPRQMEAEYEKSLANLKLKLEAS